MSAAHMACERDVRELVRNYFASRIVGHWVVDPVDFTRRLQTVAAELNLDADALAVDGYEDAVRWLRSLEALPAEVPTFMSIVLEAGSGWN